MLWLCIGIFFFRIIDVSLGTVMTIFVIKGKKTISAIIGFFNVLIWFLVARQAIAGEETSIYIALSYSGGYAVGTYVGSIIANKFVTGNIGVQVFINSTNKSMIDIIRKKGYAVSAIQAQGIKEDEKKYMLYININRKKEKELRKLINELDDDAFIVVSETTHVQNGYFK